MSPLFKPAPTEVFAGGVAHLPSPWAHRTHKPVFIAFLVCFAVNCVTLLLGVSLSEHWRWLEGLFWLLAAATSLLGLARRLPEQNVFMASALIAAISFTIAIVAEKTRVPFGPRAYTEALGVKIFRVPWPMPFLWLVVIVSARGVARLIMRPWRKTTYYGFWVIGLACLLATVFDAGLEPFATRVRHYWFRETHVSVVNWYSAPWVNFLGWFVTALGILGFTTPWLINKQPVKQPTDYHPLVIWLLLNFYFATGNALQQLWFAVALSLSVNVLVAAYAVRGARW
jgi:uncharacterized membrane protein